MKYTLFNENDNGRILHSGTCPNPSWYCQDENGLPIPGYRLLLDVEGEPDTQYVENGMLVDNPAALQEAFETERSMALVSIDQAAEIVRGMFITTTPSQSAVYMAKENEALAFMADQSISVSQVPNLALEADRTGSTMFDVAVTYLTMAHNWRQVSALIENRRLLAKDLVRTAFTLAEVTAAAAITWSDIEALAG